MVAEGTFDRLKDRCTLPLKKCDSNKKSEKTMALPCVVLFNICVERGYLIIIKTLQPASIEAREQFGNSFNLADARKKIRVRKECCS